MRLIEGRNRQIKANILRTAAAGSEMADVILRTGLEPVGLLDGQDRLRQQLRWVEGRLQDLRERAANRDVRIAARIHRKPSLKEIRNAHVALLREQVRLLEREATILRVQGDTYAWLVLDQNPRILLPLYKEGAHRLPAPLSLAGPIMIARKAVQNGKFYIIENDLTRCLGVGDLTITPADRTWRRPFSLEIKTSGKFVERSETEIQGIAAETEHPADLSLAKAFYDAAGLRDMPEEMRARDDPAQTKELLARAEVLYAATENVHRQISAVSDKPWRTIRTVVSRAMAEGMCWDLSEPGIAFFAVKALNGRPDPDALAEVQGKLADLGLNVVDAITSEDFLKKPHWSPLARPIPLWPVPVSARAALLGGDLVFGAATTRGVFEKSLRDAGLTVVDHGDEWELSGPFGTTTLDVIELNKLSLGVVFGGVSPAEIGKRLMSAKPPESEAALPSEAPEQPS